MLNKKSKKIEKQNFALKGRNFFNEKGLMIIIALICSILAGSIYYQIVNQNFALKERNFVDEKSKNKVAGFAAGLERVSGFDTTRIDIEKKPIRVVKQGESSKVTSTKGGTTKVTPEYEYIYEDRNGRAVFVTIYPAEGGFRKYSVREAVKKENEYTSEAGKEISRGQLPSLVYSGANLAEWNGDIHKIPLPRGGVRDAECPDSSCIAFTDRYEKNVYINNGKQISEEEEFGRLPPDQRDNWQKVNLPTSELITRLQDGKPTSLTRYEYKLVLRAMNNNYAIFYEASTIDQRTGKMTQFEYGTEDNPQSRVVFSKPDGFGALDIASLEKYVNSKLSTDRSHSAAISALRQTLSRQFFSNVGSVFTEFQGLSYLPTLFMDEDSLREWRDGVDKVFATAYLGTEYWSSAICSSYLDGEDEGIAYAETPQGLSQIGAHIEATRTEPIITNNETVFIYKITFNIRNGDYEKDLRAPEVMNFNVILKMGKADKEGKFITGSSGNADKATMKEINSSPRIIFNFIKADKGDVKVFIQDQNVTRGSTFGRSGKNAIVHDSPILYEQVCLKFDKIPLRWKLNYNELCNKIQETSGEVNRLVKLKILESLKGSKDGGRSDEINDF